MLRSRLLSPLFVLILVIGTITLVLPGARQPARAAAGDAVTLDVPSLVHSTGAELHWSRFAGPSTFDRYEVWRGTASGFTASAGTLVATVRDIDTTTWLDTTAAPAASGTRDYWYRIVVNGTDASADQKASVPTDGLATLNLQPAPADGQATYVSYGASITTTCYGYNNYGAATILRTGSASNSVVHRPLLRFDLRDIPPGATVSSATLKLSYGSNTAAPGTVNVHRVTRAWDEGKVAYPGGCDGSGADWREARAGQSWTTAGGDFDTTASGSDTTHSSTGGTDSFTVTSLVQGWANGTYANLGMLVKIANEAIPLSTDPPKYFDYYSDDYGTGTARPQLLVTFADGSHARKPSVSVAAPDANSKVSGSSVPVTASASDDGTVTKVDLAVDGTVFASDTSRPYTATWNSTTATNGTHTVTATAYDETGAATTASSTVTVDNTAAPTLSITSPTAGSTLSGTSTLSASATDDVGVTKVEFYADGRHLGDDSTSPYSMAWNTLDPLYTSFDDPTVARTVTVKAYDSSGNVTTRSIDVAVDNTSGTRFSATFDLNAAGPDDDFIPPAMASNTTTASTDTYSSGGRTLTSSPVDSTSSTLSTTTKSTTTSSTTAAGGTTCPATSYCPTVTVTNTSQTAWKGGNLRLWYRWYTVDGSILYEGPAADTFPQTVQPGQSKTLPVVINPPALPTGIDLSLVRLRLDIYDADADSASPQPYWYSQFGNKPVDNPVLVTRDLDSALGLERYYGYAKAPLGGGMGALTNIANGNLLVHFSPLSQPGRGIDSVLGLTYNSLEDHSRSPFGNNWSLSLSTLTRFGEPLDVHPNKADTISGRSNKYVQFIDGDGSPHVFDGVTNADGSTTWTAPPGVHLYLRSVSTDPAASRYWALSRPDHVTFYYDYDGYPTAVVDKNGNTLGLTETPVQPGEDPGGPKKRITAVTDAGSRAIQISYYSKDEAKSPHVRGNIKDVTDHGGHVLHADYYEDGNLLRITQAGGLTATGAALADRSWVFTYTTAAGDAAAIPLASDRKTPDPRTPGQSTRLFSVRDPNDHETTFSYFGPGSSNLLRWRLKTLTDRAGKTTTFGYDPTNRRTTVTDPLTHATAYAYDTDGKPTSLTNAKNETTSMAWTTDFMLRQVTEPNLAHTDYTYDPLGDVTSVTNQELEQTELTYEYRALDGTDTGQHWSLLKTKTSPRGTATTTAGDYMWTFGYDTVGNLTSATAPGQTKAATYAYDGSGQLTTATNPNGGATTYANYDPNGLPQQVTDPVGRVTRNGFDADGQQLWVQTPSHAGDSGADPRSYRTYFDYDAFHRLGRQSQPKSTSGARGTLVWTTLAQDPNDNITAESNSVYGRDDPANGARTTYGYDAMDRRTLVTSPDTSADAAGARTKYGYDDVGNLTSIIGPNSMKVGLASPNPTLVNGYDAVNRVVSRTANDVDSSTGAIKGSRVTYLCFDNVGNVAAAYQPLAGLTAAPATCPAATAANAGAHRTLYGYDKAHRKLITVEPLPATGATAHVAGTSYYPDGTVKTQTDEAGKTTTYDYDQRGLQTRVDAPFSAARTLTTLTEYDADGNTTRTISPRAYDKSADKATFTDFVTRYTYDRADQLAVVTLPTGNASNGTTTPAAYGYRSYDPEGRVASTSLPVSTAPSTTDPTQPSTPLTAAAQTKATYWDPGWVRTQTTGTNPTVRFDYAAEGWQSERSPDGAAGTSPKTEFTSYFPTGNVRSRNDPEGHSEQFTYDAAGQLTKGVTNVGITDPTQSASTITGAYNGYGEITKTTSKQAAQTYDIYSTYTYDTDGQVVSRQENGKEGGTTAAPNRVTLSYDGAGWLTDQYDYGAGTTCANDQHVTTTYLPTGWESQRVMARMASTCTGAETSTASSYPTKQTTKWTYNDNGKLATLNVLDAASHVLQTRTVGYDDPAGVYNDGVRTSDAFSLNGPSSTQCKGSTPTCTARYVYDARGKLVWSDDGHGTQTSYTLDGSPTGCTTADPSIRAGNVTTEAKAGGSTVTRCYSGNQQSAQIDPSGSYKYWYDDLGRLQCITTTAVTSRDQCNHSDGEAADSAVRQVNSYDYLNHLVGTRKWDSAGTKTDSASYVYDALDRITTEKETHKYGTVASRTTTFSYLGFTSQVLNDHQSSTAVCAGVNTSLTADKSYLYDAYEHRVSLGDRSASCSAATQPTTATMYDYGYDVHGSVGSLNKDGNTTGSASAVYSYTPYGQEDDQSDQAKSLSKGDVLQGAAATNGTARNDNPLNPFRFSGKRYDTGSQTLDTGARRLDLGSGRFLQQDLFRGALDDLGLSSDPLNQNRYALAGANPVGFAETDGHMMVADGGGGSSTSPTPTTSASSCTSQSSSPAPPPPPKEEEHRNVFQAFGHWLGEHKAEVTGFVAGTVVAVGCEVATAGAGTIGCAAAGGAVANAVTYGMSTPKEEQSVGGYAKAALVGGATGAVFGAAGKLAGPALSRIGSALGKTAPEADSAASSAAAGATRNAASDAATSGAGSTEASASSGAGASASRGGASAATSSASDGAGGAARTTAVIGRQPDTAVAKNWPGHEVLDLPANEWTLAKNDQWVQSVINRKMPVYVGSPTTWSNLWDAAAGRPTVFARELQQFTGAGYTWDSWTMMPPGG